MTVESSRVESRFPCFGTMACHREGWIREPFVEADLRTVYETSNKPIHARRSKPSRGETNLDNITRGREPAKIVYMATLAVVVVAGGVRCIINMWDTKDDTKSTSQECYH